MMLTSDRWSERILGGNTMSDVEQRTIWIATGNNLQVSDEIARRSVLCQLITQEEHPEDIPHDIKNLAYAVLHNRPRILQNLLTVIKGYFDVPEMERPRGKEMGSFEEWSTMIGGMLEYAGWESFRDNHSLLRERDTDSDEWVRFFKWWCDTFDKPLSSRELIEYIYKEADFGYKSKPLHQDAQYAMPGFLHELLTKRGEDNAKRVMKLSHYLRSRKNTNHGGYILHYEEPTSNSRPGLWWIEHKKP